MHKLLQEAVDSMLRIDSEKELLKDIAEKASDELDIKKGDWSKMVQEAFSNSISERVQSYQEILSAMESLK